MLCSRTKCTPRVRNGNCRHPAWVQRLVSQVRDSALLGQTDMEYAVSTELGDQDRGGVVLTSADLLGPHMIKFGIESKNSCPTTSTTKFKHHLAQALRDMRRVCEAVES